MRVVALPHDPIHANAVPERYSDFVLDEGTVEVPPEDVRRLQTILAGPASMAFVHPITTLQLGRDPADPAL